eukprot:NODE_115_length_18417_cov_0.666012.p15 type:complete len:120 gc:universal NODE_115_length_18417_cov_0.666012:6942-6583(-)
MEFVVAMVKHAQVTTVAVNTDFVVLLQLIAPLDVSQHFPIQVLYVRLPIQQATFLQMVNVVVTEKSVAEVRAVANLVFVGLPVVTEQKIIAAQAVRQNLALAPNVSESFLNILLRLLHL